MDYMPHTSDSTLPPGGRPGLGNRKTKQDVKQAEAASPWRQIVESVFDATLCTDDEGKVVYCSPRTHELFEKYGHEPYGRHFWDVFDLPVQSLEQALEFCDGNGMCLVQAAGGRQRLAMKIVPMPEMQHQGQSYALLLMGLEGLVDYLEQGSGVNADSPLVHALVRSVFQEAREPMLLLDRAGHVVAGNGQATALFSDGNDSGKTLEGEQLETLLPETQGRALEEQILSMNGKDLECCCSVTDKHGQLRHLEVHASKVAMGKKRFLYKLAFEDMSERKLLEEGLQQKAEEVEEMQITLRNVMRSAVQEKESFKEDLSHMIKVEVLPTLRKLTLESDEELRSNYQSVIKDQLGELAGTAEHEADMMFYELTPTELQVCEYIRAGHATKEISETMHLAFETVQTHRKNIRRKLGLKGRKVSLYMFLRSRGRMS